MSGDNNEASGLSSLASFASAAAHALLSDDRVSADPISRVAGSVTVSVPDRIALSDARLRTWVAVSIVATFIIANGIVLAGVWLMFNREMVALQGKVYDASLRVITSSLLMTLVGATTVQLGALTILMGKYLFPAPKQ